MTFSSDFLAQLRAARGQTTPSAAQLDALHAAGYVTGAGTLTPDGWAVLAQVLDAAALPPEGER